MSLLLYVLTYAQTHTELNLALDQYERKKIKDGFQMRMSLKVFFSKACITQLKDNWVRKMLRDSPP